jgi:hypothetical protein
VTAVLVEEAPDRTRVDVNTDLTITGKAAQFGRGVMQDVAGRIVDQFSANLATMIGAAGAAAAGAAAAGAVTGDGAAATATAPAPSAPQADDAIDLLGTAGAPVLKRAIPVAVGLVVVVGIIIWAVRR